MGAPSDYPPTMIRDLVRERQELENPSGLPPLPEVCPHSSLPTARPDQCSQCLSSQLTHLGTVVKLIEVHDGVVLENGVPRGLLSDISRETQHREKQETVPHAKRVCGRCRRPGHDITTCPKRLF